MDRLLNTWPGNVRELENTIERSMVLATGKYLERRISVLKISGKPNGVSTQEALLPEGVTLEQWEQNMIREAIRRADGNKSQAARLLGLTRNALRYRLSQMGMETEKRRRGRGRSVMPLRTGITFGSLR